MTEMNVDRRIETIDLTVPLRRILKEPQHIYLGRDKKIFEDAKESLRKRKTIIWVEGVMGCGKSTLAEKLAEYLDLECFLEDPDHHVIKKDLDLLYSGDKKLQKIGAVNINNDYLGFRMADYCDAMRGARSAVLDRISHADDLYMAGFIEDGFMTPEEVEAVRIRRRNTIEIYSPTNAITSPLEIVVQLVGKAELFYRRKNHRARGVEISDESGKGVSFNYINRLTRYYQEDPGLGRLLANTGYKGPLIFLPQEITRHIEYDPNNRKHLAPLLETLTAIIN